MKICFQLIYTADWVDLAKITVPNIVNYCRKHGYDWNIQSIQGRYSGYLKILNIQSLFAANDADVIVSLDCDTLITNYNIKIEDYLDDTHSFFICEDYNGLNAGVFVIKNSKWSADFLSYILQCEGQSGMYCEQDAILSYMKSFPNNENIKILPHPSINSYLYESYPEIPPQSHEQGQWVEGDYILHLPGMDNQTRIKILTQIPILL